MTPERWNEILERSDSLRPVPMHQERSARSAVRLHLVTSANTGLGPVGLVSYPRYLMPDPAPPFHDPQQAKAIRQHAERKARGLDSPGRGSRMPDPVGAPRPTPAPAAPVYRDPSKRALEEMLADAARNTAKVPFAGKDFTEKPFRKSPVKKERTDG